MDNLTAGNPRAHAIRVRYIGTSTIYEGMPVCYNYDTTTNWFGGSASNGEVTASTTLTAGSPNTAQAKYIEVENPATANLSWFAGVVKKGGWVGKTGPQTLDVYVPNGAIVPIRSYVSSTLGSTALYIMNGQQYFGNPASAMGNGEARCVAIAEETVNRSSVAGLILAKLCPDQFIYQVGASAKLSCCTAGTVNDIAPNIICVSSAATSGGFSALFIRSEVATACSNDTAIAIYSEANLTGVSTGTSNTCANRFSLNIWGGTQTSTCMCGVMAEIYEQDATLSSAIVCPLAIRDQVTNAPSRHYMIYCESVGSDTVDGLLYARSAASIGYATTSNVTAMAHIPIYVEGVGLRYILLEDTA